MYKQIIIFSVFCLSKESLQLSLSSSDIITGGNDKLIARQIRIAIFKMQRSRQPKTTKLVSVDDLEKV